jgi:ribosomal protein S1
VTLRGNAVVESATLPDGREAVVRVGVPTDPYIPKSELDTVAVEVTVDEQVAAAVNTVLDVDQVSEARQLAREIVNGLESGALEPTAGAIEPLATELH